MAVNGFFSLGIFSVAYELAVELSFPIGEATSGGVINSLANAFSFIQVMILTPFLSNPSTNEVLACFFSLGSILVIALFLITFAKIKYKRRDYEMLKRADLLIEQSMIP